MTAYAFIALGVFAIVGATVLAVSGDQTKGHLLFLTAAFMWACYAIVLRQSRLDPLHAAALVAAGSCFLYLPFYFAAQGAHALGAPTTSACKAFTVTHRDRRETIFL